jgi:LCP family protein required for cell wall assembly
MSLGRGKDGGTEGGRKGRGDGRALLRWSAIVLAVVILGTAGAGYLYYQHLNSNIEKDPLNIGDEKDGRPTKANAAGQTPLNILLIGSDARDSAENQKLGGAKDTFGSPPLRRRPDAAPPLGGPQEHVGREHAARHPGRHPQVHGPGHGQEVRGETNVITNDSLGRGGPGCTVATWEKLTDIHIDHFMMVDFAGVVSMADAIGGVEVCVDANIWDSHTSPARGSGLKLKKGTTAVKGKQALQWLRTRYGFEDDTDIARTKAQHQYMNSMVRQLRENATLSNPTKLRSLAETATKALTVDKELGTVKPSCTT